MRKAEKNRQQSRVDKAARKETRQAKLKRFIEADEKYSKREQTFEILLRHIRGGHQYGSIPNVKGHSIREARNRAAHIFPGRWVAVRALCILLLFVVGCSTPHRCATYGYKKVYVNGKTKYFDPHRR